MRPVRGVTDPAYSIRLGCSFRRHLPPEPHRVQARILPHEPQPYGLAGQGGEIAAREPANACSPVSDVPASALNRSSAGTPGRGSIIGQKFWENGAIPARTMLFALLPPR